MLGFGWVMRKLSTHHFCSDCISFSRLFYKTAGYTIETKGTLYVNKAKQSIVFLICRRKLETVY
jgi:hypothetical protein